MKRITITKHDDGRFDIDTTVSVDEAFGMLEYTKLYCRVQAIKHIEAEKKAKKSKPKSK